MSFDLGFGFGLGLRCWTLPWRVHLSLFRCLLRLLRLLGFGREMLAAGCIYRVSAMKCQRRRGLQYSCGAFFPGARALRPLCGRATSVKNTQLLNSLAENLVRPPWTRFSAREFNRGAWGRDETVMASEGRRGQHCGSSGACDSSSACGGSVGYGASGSRERRGPPWFAAGGCSHWLETGKTPGGNNPGGGNQRVGHQGFEPRTH